MVVLRRTQKLASQLPESAVPPTESDTALGDWYVNRITIDRRPLLLLVCDRSLLSIVVPAREVRGLPSRLADLVAQRLRRLGLPRRWIDAEVEAMSPVMIGKTTNRATVGIMVDFAKMLPYYVEPGAWDETTPGYLESRLQKNPCFAGTRHSLVPERATPRLMQSRWDAR